MRTYITALMLVITLGLVSCGGGNDVASSGATAVSAAATDSSSTSAPSTTTPTTEPKVNGQIDERTGVAPVAAQMTIGGFVYYSTVYRGSYLEAITLTPNGYRACGTGSTPNQAFVSCLNSSANQFTFVSLNGVSIYTTSWWDNPYGAFMNTSTTPCGTGSTPNQAIVSCVNSPANQFTFYNGV